MPDTSLRESLNAGVVAMGQALLPDQAAGMIEYLRLLERWNRSFNLTAVRDIDEMVPRHLLDSLSIRPWVNEGPILDVGSGAGLPGIPLAIAEPALHFVLVDSVSKRCRFLTQAIVGLGLANVSVENRRVEDYRLSPGAQNGPGPADGQGFPLITARAYSSLKNLVETAGHLLADDGKVLAMKGTLPDQEIGALPAGWRLSRAEKLTVPGVDGDRHLLIIEKTTGD